MEIVGKNMDKLTVSENEYNEGKSTASYSFVVYDMVAFRRMNDSVKTIEGQPEHWAGYNNGGWVLSDARNWMNNTLFAALPKELQTGIKSVEKKCDMGQYYYKEQSQEPVTVSDLIWMPSAEELGGTSLSNVVSGQNNPYPLFTTYSSRKKNGGVYYTRSSNMSLMHYFEGVDSAGNWTTVTGAGGAGMVFGFCL